MLKNNIINLRKNEENEFEIYPCCLFIKFGKFEKRWQKIDSHNFIFRCCSFYKPLTFFRFHISKSTTSVIRFCMKN